MLSDEHYFRKKVKVYPCKISFAPFQVLNFFKLGLFTEIFLKAVKLSASLFMLEKIAENLQSKKVLNVFAP